MTPDEFFAWQAEQEVNDELVDGLPVPTPKGMTGASRRHDVVTVNILRELATQLRGKPCRPHTDDIAVRNPNLNVRRPDIVVDCKSAPDRLTEATEPRVLVEVLSSSTMHFDRFRKVEEYKNHEAVRVVLLVASEAPEVIVWRKEGDAWRSEIVEGTGATIPLPEIGARLALADIHEETNLLLPSG